MNDRMIVKASTDFAWKFLFKGHYSEPVGAIRIDKHVVTFEGDFDKSAELFVEYIAKRWSQQWQTMETELNSVKRECQIIKEERDALREENVGSGSNTRNAADIYFQLVEECQIPPGGSLVDYVRSLGEKVAAMEVSQ